MRNFALGVLAIAIALGGGMWSAEHLTRDFNGFGAINVGVWSAHPAMGRADADPYARAKMARTGEIPLGAAEGLAFIAQRDDSGRELNNSCQYRLSGKVPASRFWTLRARPDIWASSDLSLDTSLEQVRPNWEQLITHSRAVNFKDSGEFEITFGNPIVPGNWHQASTNGDAFRFVLTLYDTPVSSTTALAELTMPSLERTTCNAR